MRVQEAMGSDVPASPSNVEEQKQVFGCFLMADAEARGVRRPRHQTQAFFVRDGV